LTALGSQDEARRLASLRRWNLGVGSAHLAQAVIILLLAGAVSLPVSVTYLTGPPGAGEYGGPKPLFDLRVDIAVAAFLLLAAVDLFRWERGGGAGTSARSPAGSTRPGGGSTRSAPP